MRSETDFTHKEARGVVESIFFPRTTKGTNGANTDILPPNLAAVPADSDDKGNEKKAIVPNDIPVSDGGVVVDPEDRFKRPNFVGTAGRIKATTYRMELGNFLRNTQVSMERERVWEEHGMDYYTDIMGYTLEELDANYDSEIEGFPKHLRVKNGVLEKRSEAEAHKTLLEIDHVWDVQLWATAIEIVDKWAPKTDDRGHPFQVSFAQALYLYDMVNGLDNLNITTWKINKAAKNHLMYAFIHHRFDMAPNATREMMSADNILNTSTRERLSPKDRVLLRTRAWQYGEEPAEMMYHRIGHMMVDRLHLRFSERLLKPEGDWNREEIAYFGNLYRVLEYMCRVLWPTQLNALEKLRNVD